MNTKHFDIKPPATTEYEFWQQWKNVMRADFVRLLAKGKKVEVRSEV